MSDPIEDYIRANRDLHGREVLTQQLVAAGHDPAAVEAAWTRVSTLLPAPPAPPASPAPKATTNLVGLVVIVGGIIAYAWFTGHHDSTPTLNFGGNGGDKVLIEYNLTGSATGADLTYTDASGNIQQQSGVAVPLRTSSGNGIRYSIGSGAFVQFSGQNTGESGDLTCTISADGRVINTGHSSGGYTIVSCSAMVP